jgi:threonine synthase
VLFARYSLDEIASGLRRDDLHSRVRSMWRYAELLPVNSASNVVTLGEGFTPILQLRREGEAVGLEHLLMKNDGLVPTGTFKARGMASAISKCKELGVRTVAVATAGNAGAAMSAYASRANVESYVFMPKSTPTPIRPECEI